MWAKALFLAGAEAAARGGRARPPGVLVTADGTVGGGPHEGSDVLDPRPGERADRLRAAHQVGAGGARRQVPAVRPGVKAAAVTDTHRFLSLLALGAVALHGLTLVLDSTVRIGLAALRSPGSRLPACRDRSRRRRRGAAVLVVVSFPLRKRIGPRGAASTGRPTGCSPGRRSTGWPPAPTRAPLGLRALSRRRLAVASATAWRALTRPSNQGVTHVPNRDRPDAV